MSCDRTQSKWLIVVAGVLCIITAAQGKEIGAAPDKLPQKSQPTAFQEARGIEAMAADIPASARQVLEHPVLRAQGPTEFFRGKHTLYEWLLDNPDRGVEIWHRLGAPCMEIKAQGGGTFGWGDGSGSDIHWQTVHRDPNLRIWYAEGKVRPGTLLPSVPLRAVVVLHYGDLADAYGCPLIYHRADLFLAIDSHMATLVARLLGPSAPHLAEQSMAQLEIFFSALVWYFELHPEKRQALLSNLPPS